jgi:hypothetical protein
MPAAAGGTELLAPALGPDGVLELPLEPEPMFGHECFPVEPVLGVPCRWGVADF